MKANELRIGNWIYCNTLDRGIKVTYAEIECAEKMQGYFNTTFKPIPLTEEILLKCGFEKRGVIFRIDNGASHQFDVNYSTSRDIFYYDSSKYGIYTEVEIKYLHQLQNLYWCLCEKELKIEL